ncbi:MAG: response regulator [Mariprofundaceae bacterium]
MSDDTHINGGSPNALRQQHILIADDIEQSRALLESTLKNDGYHVHHACHGRQAIEILARQPIDLIISDILMPDMDGYELCRVCKTHPEWKKIPFVFYTATYTSKEDEAFSLALGASHFLIKPQRSQVFLNMIGEVLHEWQDGRMKASETRIDGDTIYMKLYNERLIHKLEGKLEQLTTCNNELTRELSLRKKAEGRAGVLLNTIEQTDDAVLISDCNGVIEYVNSAFLHLTGYDAEDLYGTSCIQLKNNNQSAEIYQMLWKTIRNGSNWQGELMASRKDGSAYPAILSVTPVRGKNEEITHFVAVQQDLSERHALEEKFYEAQKMEAVGTLAGGVAHDFNNILAGIMMNVYLAKQQIEDGEMVKTRLRNMDDACKRAAGIIEQMLTFARRNHVQPQPVSLTGVVVDALSLARFGIPENIHIEQHLCEESLTVMGSAVQIEQMLINLMNNACDALHDVREPRIIVILKSVSVPADAQPSKLADGLYAHLSIIDNGEGIKDTERIFEPFFTTKEQGKGTGLGLSMVYGSVQQHGGHVAVESAPGKGACFDVYLPLDKHIRQVISSVPKLNIQGGGRLIILADDEVFVRESMRDMLQNLGFEVIAVSNGQQAVDAVHHHLADVALVFLDVVMPVMGGVDAAHWIRKIKPGLPVIFATGYNKRNVQDMAIESFPDSVLLQNPFEVDILNDALCEMLGDKREAGA